MATYKEQITEAQSYRVREGGFHRGNCPFCGGKNTYTVNNRSGELWWNCFKASCDVGGSLQGDMSMQAIHLRLGDKGYSEALAVVQRGIPIPHGLVGINTREPVLTFLAAYNCIAAFKTGLIDIKYSPSEDRIMFPIRQGDKVVGYVGRGRQGVKPKWKKFGDCSSLLTCGLGRTAVVVEDALSACAVGIIPDYTGCSLSGTLLSPVHIVELRAFDRVIVALDPDAMSKGLELTSRLGSKATLRLIDNDLKYFGPEDIRRQLDDK